MRWLVGVSAGALLASMIGATVPVDRAPPALDAAPQARPEAAAVDPAEAECLAQALYWEARGEGSVGMQWVANAILGRLSRGWRGAASVCAVVWAPSQFEGMERAAAGDPVTEPKAMARAVEIALRALGADWPALAAVDHFHADTIKPAWASSPLLKRVAHVGGHVFYRHK